MLQSQRRFCQQKGHEQYACSLVCTFINCTENSKWVCQECLRKQKHLHGQLNQDHLMNQQEFLTIIEQNYKLDVVSQCMSQLDSLKKYITEFQEIICSNDEMPRIISIVKEDFLSLSNDQIGFSLNKQKCDSKQYLYQNVLEQAKRLEQILLSQTKNVQSQILVGREQSTIQNLTNSNVKIDSQIQSQLRSTLNKIKVINTSLEYQNYIELVNLENNQIHYALISQNEQYLALCETNKLSIYHLEDKSLLKEIKLDENISYSIFSQSSKLIYIGCDKGLLYCLELTNCYLLTKILVKEVQTFSHMIEKQSYKVLYSFERHIFQADFQQKNIEMFIFSDHVDKIVYLEYDKLNNIIVSCSNDKSIKFHSIEKKQTIINKHSAHDCKINQIQLTHNNSHLLSLCVNGVLCLWQIQLDRNQIQKIGQINLENKITSFCSVQNDRLIVIQNSNALEIYDAQLKFIKQMSSSVQDQLRGINLINIKRNTNETNQFHGILNYFKIEQLIIQNQSN